MPSASVTALGQAAATAALHAPAADRDRILHPDTVAAVTTAGFPGHFVPHRWGGRAGGYAELLTQVAALADDCASAAWCAGLWATHGRYAALMPEKCQEEIWGAGPDVRISAALMPPSGSATATAEGWSLRGEWHCVSGVEHAQWVLLAAPVHAEDVRGGDVDGEQPRGLSGDVTVRVFAVPTELLRIQDTWHSTGLRGTGSHSVVLPEVDLPHYRSAPLTTLLGGTSGPGLSRCHSAPAMLGGPLLLAAPALGAARHALHAWMTWASTSRAQTAAQTAGQTAAQTAGPAAETLARSSTEIEAAALLLERAADRADVEHPTPATVARNRKDAAFASDLLVTAVERLLRTGGAHVRDNTGVLQRCWRDVHTVTAHGALRLDTAAESYASTVLIPEADEMTLTSTVEPA
ncbi:alkylation response protein AidB-like acyl-CoA dehydrogenase [Streptacidiphilus sp. BW17]|uniref:oxidoreductase n=1 Tax=Streptacidiphilus sp. BW17 TaxID=3156274 RepID=UPI003517EEB3